ncbi:MAG: DUF4166 domain-containing protein [Polaromonas sp.]|nr:DUF4166 domain-containing protein [Polaromonas sp.]
MSLVQSVMGEAFGRLAPSLQHFHSLQGRVALAGRVQTEAPATRMARWLARGLGAPHEAMDGAIRFELDAGAAVETWTRHFPQHRMRSQLRRAGIHLVEELGAFRLYFTLVEQGAALRMQLDGLRCFGVPCPRWLLPEVHAVETGSDGRVLFDVRAALPGLGTVSAYRGHLVLPAEGSLP